jgi:hypothetical protein
MLDCSISWRAQASRSSCNHNIMKSLDVSTDKPYNMDILMRLPQLNYGVWCFLVSGIWSRKYHGKDVGMNK